MKTDRPKLQETKDYDIFEEHEYNRPVRANRVLLESMAKHGFMPRDRKSVV